MGNVNALKRDVQALVVIQKDRVLEQLKKQAEVKPAPPEPVLQYPRPKPAQE